MSENKSERLIPAEEEDWFREEFEYYWNKGCTAKEIFEEMQFDDNDNAPWKLKLYHVYYFANKFGLKKRNQRRTKRVC